MTKLHSVHPKKGRGHFDLCPACYTDNFIIMRPDYFIQRNEIHRCKRTSRPAFLYDHKAGDFFGCSFRFNAFYVKDRLSQAVKAGAAGIFIKHCTWHSGTVFWKRSKRSKTLVCSRTDLLSAGRVCKAYADFHAELIFS